MENSKKNPILRSDSKTPYFGFYMNTISFVGIYFEYIKPSHMQNFYAFSISQDHVETFFGCIRQRGGHNCNPTSQHFMAAYRRLLVHNEVVSPDAGNCENDITKVLDVSSRVKKSAQTPNDGELEMLSQLEDDDFDPIFDEDSDEDHESDSHESTLNKHCEAYQGSLLEKRVSRKLFLNGKQQCLQCMNVFNENPRLQDSFIVFLSNSQQIKQPCTDTIKIIRMLEKSLKKYESQEVSFQSIITHILQKFDVSLVYESSLFGVGYGHDHKIEFIRLIIEEYFDMKSTYISKLVTRLAQKKLLRHDRLKEVHREGQ